MENQPESHLIADLANFKLIRNIYKSHASPTIIDLYEATDSTPLILKRLEKSMIFTSYQTESARREIAIHRALHHPNVAELFDSAETAEEFLLLMEFLPKHDYFTEKIEIVINI